MTKANKFDLEAIESGTCKKLYKFDLEVKVQGHIWIKKTFNKLNLTHCEI